MSKLWPETWKERVESVCGCGSCRLCEVGARVIATEAAYEAEYIRLMELLKPQGAAFAEAKAEWIKEAEAEADRREAAEPDHIKRAIDRIKAEKESEKHV